MPDRILALHRMDLSTAAQLLAQLRASGEVDEQATLTVLDPVLHTYAMLNGHPQVHLAQAPFCDISTGATPRAWAATRTVCAAVEGVLADLVPEAVGAAWCGHWFQLLHLVTLGWRNIAERMAPRLKADRLHLLLPDQPYVFGFHSFAPGLVFSDAMRQAGVAVKLFASPLGAVDAPLLPDVLAPGGAADVDLLCHLPTCFYDAALFSAEIQASGRRALVLPAQFYDVATEGLPRCAMVSPATLAQALPPVVLARIEATLDRLHEVISRHLAPFLPAAGLLDKQVKAMLEGFRCNALVFFALAQRFAQRPPRTLLLSNHEGGYHGALFSFARRHGAQIVLVPHSKIFNVPVKSRGHDVLCLTHPLQGSDVLDLNGDRMPTAALDFGESLRFDAVPAQPLATLGIVLNTLSDTGMVLPDLADYLGGLRRLRQWCQANGVDCRIRCRPNGSVLALLGPALGLSVEDLAQHQEGGIADFGRGCDLVIGYDTPTSGVFELLDQGLPVMQALCRRLGLEEWSIVDARVVPQWPVDEVLQRLGMFKADALALWRFRRDQRSQHVAARAGALPLRHWL